MIDFRALCQELMDAIDSGIPCERIKQSPLAVRVDAALAHPEPQGPSKHELFDLLMQAGGATQCVSVEWLEPFADAVLARWGRPAIASELEEQ